MFTNRPDTVAHSNTQCTPSAHSAMANCTALWLPPSILMRAYQRILCQTHVYANAIHTCRSVRMPLRHIYTHRREKRTILCTMFVPVAGNWRVFIRLMDMKRKGEGGWTEKEGGKEGGRVGGHWIIPQQILYNGPTSHIAACNFLAAMIERGILQLHRLALITQNLPHKSAPVEWKWAVAYLVLLLTATAALLDGLSLIRITGLPAHTPGWQSLINGLTLFKRLGESRDSSYRTGQGCWSMVKMCALLQCSFTSSSTGLHHPLFSFAHIVVSVTEIVTLPHKLQYFIFFSWECYDSLRQKVCFTEEKKPHKQNVCT